MFYEFVAVIRPDVPMSRIGEFYSEVSSLVEKEGGKIEGAEYWGFRTLAYRIEKRGKAHYVFLGISLKESGLRPLEHYLKFQPDLMRFLIVRKPEGFTFPTPLYHSDLKDAISGIGPSSPVRSVEEKVSSNQ